MSWLMPWLGGVGTGFAIGVWAAFKVWLVTPTDPIAIGIRQQMANVKAKRQFVGDDYQISSFATVETVQGDFQVIVRQPITPIV